MVSFDIIGYLIFAFATSITPGPNNFMLLAYGKNHGLKDSGKLMFGIFMGFTIMLYVSGYGIASLITANKTIGLGLKIASSAWLLYLAFMIKNMSSNNGDVYDTKFGFSHGFFMQFANPKAYIMAVSGASAFMPQLGNIHLNVSIFAFSFGLVGVPSMLAWLTFGDAISRFTKSSKAHAILGITLFLMMLMSILLIWM